MKCIIPCAGESSRMSYIPKHLIRIGGKPLLKHVIDIWKDSVDNFIFILKRSMTYLWEYLPENSAVVFQDEPKGLADAILKVEPYVDNDFVLALGDCLQKGQFGMGGKKLPIGIGVWKKCSLEELNKSYSVEEYQGLVKFLVEKPRVPDESHLDYLGCGMGTYFLDRRIFKYIKDVLPKLVPGGGDLTEILQHMIFSGEEIVPVHFRGNYMNVTSPEDIKKAEGMLGN